ncbi:hypothetical protein P7K49_021991 [Saguinus oedipus]|uniref:Uncharacterized protein n=1 Tax=Saguinus oedipus TaxID=9490 RepID=A0ABQ9UW01_SAGOE|nr:hypothetical protein P7K49_021991 [Saguinus oedipus]
MDPPLSHVESCYANIACTLPNGPRETGLETDLQQRCDLDPEILIPRQEYSYCSVLLSFIEEELLRCGK